MLLLKAITLALFWQACHSAKFSGDAGMKNSDGWVYLGKFCYQDVKHSNTSTAGIADIKLTYSGAHKENWYLVLYDDQSSSWPAVHDSSLTCRERIANEHVRYRHGIQFGNEERHNYSIAVREKVRPRWWWAYVVNCDLEGNASLASAVSDVSYSLHFYQYDVSMWNEEAGVNDRGLNTVYLFYLCFYVLLFGIQLYAYHVYRVQQYVHQVIKLLTSVVGVELFAVLFSFVDWMVFTETGKHELFFQIMSEIGYVTSNTIFLLLLLVLGQGWTVSRFEVVYPKSILLLCIVSALFQCGFFIWILVGFDDETTKYYYDTVPEWLYGALFVVVGLVYVAECIYSFKTETLDSKKKLYIALCLIFSSWFLVPILQIAIADAVEPWSRDLVVDTIELSWNTLTFCIMMAFMWPTWAHQYFNLSMGDTQDRILSGGGIGSGIGSKKAGPYKSLNQNRL